MASPCVLDDDASSPSHGWCVVRGACCVPRETRQNRSTPTRVSRETLRSVYGCSCVSREATSPRREVLMSCVGSRRIAAEHRLGGVGSSLSTCPSSGGSALSRSASTSAGAAMRAIGGPPARVSREALTPAVLSPAVLVCACTNEFEPPLSGESYDMANGSENGGIASSAPAVTIQHSVPFHGKLTHNTLPSPDGPTLRCVRRERFARAGEGSNGARVCSQLVRTPCRRGTPFMFHGEHAGDLQECRAAPQVPGGTACYPATDPSPRGGGFHVCPKDVPTPAATPRRHGPA